MAQDRPFLAASVSLALHAGLLTILIWLLIAEQGPAPQRQAELRVVPIDLPRVPQPHARLHYAESNPASPVPRTSPARWLDPSEDDVKSALNALARLDCLIREDEQPLADCLERLRLDARDGTRHLTIRDGADPRLMALAIERRWTVLRSPPDVQRVLARKIDVSYRDEHRERYGLSPIPEDPYLR